MDLITKKISELPEAGLLDGTELLEVVKNATNTQTSLANIRGVVQTSGQSTEKVMSQKAVTDSVSTAVASAVANKVDKVTGKGLSDTNFTQAEKTKLTGIATAATANRADTLNADKVHAHGTNDVTGLSAALLTKFDKTDVVQATGQSTGKVMSQKAVTDLVGDIESVLVAINGEP